MAQIPDHLARFRERAPLVRRVALQVFGARPHSVTALPYGYTNTCFDVRVAGGRYIIRTNAVSVAFNATAEHARALAALDVPVPVVVATGVEAGVGWIVLQRLPGRDVRAALPAMSSSQRIRLANDLVALQRRVTSLPAAGGAGFGTLSGGGSLDRWSAVFLACLDAAAGAPSSVSGDLVARTRGAVLEAAAALDERPRHTFLPDLTTKNVLIARGRLSGIVDIDAIAVGDPLFWLSLAAVCVQFELGTDCMDYTEAVCAAWGPVDAGVDALYRAVHGCDFLAWADGGAQGRDAATAAVDGWLESLGA